MPQFAEGLDQTRKLRGIYSLPSMPSSADTHLGFADELEPSQLFELERQYLPLGKCGGHPAWLNPAAVPPSSDTQCPNCDSPMAFLLQLYCPVDHLPHAFHRVLYIFVCRKGKCAKLNNAANFAVFRCQLPRENSFYSATEALNPGVVGDVPDPYFDAQTFAQLCVVCGCRADKRCARCAGRWYCSRDHQIIDWNSVHKAQCSSTTNNSAEPQEPSGLVAHFSQLSCGDRAEQRSKQGFTFKEFAMELSADEEGAKQDGDEIESDDDSDGEEEGAMEVGEIAMKEEDKERLREFEELAKANGVTARDIDGLEESIRDVAFQRFSAALKRCPEQILRYSRVSSPLLATDHSPAPTDIPDCELCGAERTFECQLMPHLVALMELDALGESSLDWATVLVYSCSANCAIPNDGYAQEFAFKQDFVSAEPDKRDAKRK